MADTHPTGSHSIGTGTHGAARGSAHASGVATGVASASDALALAAVGDIRSGMIVGIGTGRTAARATRALADRVHREGLSIRCVCTSDGSEALARELNLPTIPFSELEAVDYLFDGAAEVDTELRMLKGQHGALAQQRLVARAAKRSVYLVDESKLVSRLGEQATLPVCVMAFGLAFVREELRMLGLAGVVRRNMVGEYFVTDSGALIIDVMMPQREPEQVADEIDAVPGVIDHGLFLSEATEVLVERKSGLIDRMMRE
ncbi:MAG: ribose 5-phosphate isomerase A [Planctomycetota bacterium]|nr:ribose 5-phosphate isomerase A [Planctomycetota bacterium]